MVEDPNHAPVLREESVLHQEGMACSRAPIDGFPDPRLIVGMDAVRRVPSIR
jgi:hypothetical protein